VQESKKISKHFTCHAWDKSTGYIIVCTDNGEMLVLQNSGLFKAFILESPLGKNIECIYPYAKGVIVAVADNFFFYHTETDDDDNDRMPLRRIADSAAIQMATKETFSHERNNNVMCIAVPSKEDQIYIMTQQG